MRRLGRALGTPAVLVALSVLSLAFGARLAIGPGWDLIVAGIAGLVVAAQVTFRAALLRELDARRPTREAAE